MRYAVIYPAVPRLTPLQLSRALEIKPRRHRFAVRFDPERLATVHREEHRIFALGHFDFDHGVFVHND